VTAILYVKPQTVDAAKLKIKRDRARGLPVDEAVQAIADARPPQSSGCDEPAAEADEGRAS